MYLTQAYLKERLFYTLETGMFIWRSRVVRPHYLRTDRAWNTKWAGKTAGTITKKCNIFYIVIGLNGKHYLAHRLAFLYITGHFPKGQIDHEDSAGANNSWSNLRLATQSQNQANAKLRFDNTSGYKGVSFDKSRGQYKARIQVNSHGIHLGYFDTGVEAHSAYKSAARLHFGRFARVK